MGLKTTSDEREYQFLLADEAERIKAEGNISPTSSLMLVS